MDNAGDRPQVKKLKLVPNIAEELAKNRSPPASYEISKKQLSISSLLSDPQSSHPASKTPAVILPSQGPGPSVLDDLEASKFAIARTKSPISTDISLERSKSNVVSELGTIEKPSAVQKSVSNIESIFETRKNSPVVSSVSGESNGKGLDLKEKIGGKSSKPISRGKLPAKHSKEGKANGKTNRKESGKKTIKTEAEVSGLKENSENKDNQDLSVEIKPKTESKSKSDITNVASTNKATKPQDTKKEPIDDKINAKKDKNKKKKPETPRNLVSAPSIKSPKVLAAEANGKPVVILDVPLHDVDDSDYLDENGQVVFNVYNMIQEKYGNQLNKTKRNLMVDLNEDVEAAEDNEGEEDVEAEQDAEDDDDDDDDDEDDDDDDDDEGAQNVEANKSRDISASPKKKRPHPMKGKSRIGKYDIEDPFIDDSELLWEEQRAATKDGFFVYFGPLIEKGQYASFQRVDGTMKKGGIKNPK